MANAKKTNCGIRDFLKRHSKALYLFSIGILIAMFIIAFGFTVMLSTDKNATASTFYSTVSTAVFMLFALILYISCFMKGFYKTKQDVHFALSVFFLSSLLFVCFIQAYCYGRKEFVHIETVTHYILVVLSCLTFLAFWFYHLEELPKTRLGKYFTLIICIEFSVYILLYLISIKTGFMIYITPERTIVFPHLIIDYSSVLIFEMLYMISVISAKIELKKKVVMISFSVLPIFCLIIDCILSFALNIKWVFTAGSYAFILMSCYLIFINASLEEKEMLLIREKQIAESEKKQFELQSAVMMSQIQPHFLYNALVAIRVLCREDPKRGDEAIVNFSHYLRENMDSLQSNLPIPFEKELDHTKTYLMLEKMRFGDELNTVYEIGCSDFVIPALTLQPLVENAVRHGICQNENGGTVTIRTERVDGEIQISVTDDGPGFDTSKQTDDGKSHIGIKNARTRLQIMLNGELNISSTVGKGTTATIILRERIT